jgi:hypothetical protein
MIQHCILFAACHKGEASQIRQHSPSAILSIEPEQGVFPQELVRCEVARDGRETLTQFLPVAPVAPVAKRAEPLEAVGLADDRAGPHHLPTLAPPVARGTDLIQPATSRGQFFGLGQGALASGLSCAIEIKNHPCVSRSIC